MGSEDLDTQLALALGWTQDDQGWQSPQGEVWPAQTPPPFRHDLNVVAKWAIQPLHRQVLDDELTFVYDLSFITSTCSGVVDMQETWVATFLSDLPELWWDIHDNPLICRSTTRATAEALAVLAVLHHIRDNKAGKDSRHANHRA